MLQDLRENLRRTLPAQLQSKVEVIGHTWGEDMTKLQTAGPFDLLLAADLVWVRSSHPLLIASLLRLLEDSPNAIIHLACGFHSGKAVVRDFFASAEEAGLVPAKTYEGECDWFEMSVTGEKNVWCKYGHCGELELSQEARNKLTLVAALKRGW
ncbi:hypothetical protein BCR35DRAFT_298977 [Leucosporidium creatinivorum]|uniref:Methyltransferase-domain-containing protein n=1 Tax=Leucosporidium creatinivorum TaxID=106004 RepID=A0A1Y2G2W6_9BASI|nr:hypothetical protein BCR35DRAFT_298977 [Leucosporidium creatinivorum]